MQIEDGFWLDGQEVLPAEGLIRGPNGARHVEPKAMDVLLELASHAPALRTRMQIEQVVWPRGFVGEDALTRCIGQLRRALGDAPRAARLLLTIPRRGYRLQAPVELRPPANLAPPPLGALLVLPFLQLSTEVDALSAQGLTELLILRLCALPGLRVLSRSTSMQFQTACPGMAEIAARTGADWIVEGSLLQDGQRLQAVAQLIDAHTDTHLWAADFSSSRQSLLQRQNDIAERMARSLRAQLLRSDPPAERPCAATAACSRSGAMQGGARGLTSAQAPMRGG